jgi:ubiquinol-cytochrome c reductase cytochrome b subunit
LITSGLPDEPGFDVAGGRGKAGLPARLWRWLDRRTGADELLRKTLDEPIPGGARLAFVFGSALLFIFVSQIITGLCLTLYYVPSPQAAHVTLAYIIKDVAAGAFLRSLHSYGSSAMIVVLVLHFLQTFLYGSYKGRRELLWISGCVLALVVLGMTFTGYLLRWDLKAYFAGSVGTNIAGDVPLIGGWLLRLLRGGATMGALTLSRFYVLHVFLLPATIFLFVAIHLVLFRKAGAAGPMAEDAVHPHLPTDTFYPKQVIIDMLFVLVVMGILGMLAHFVPEELGPAADPSNSTYLPRPEWYYLPFFEWLKFWDGAKTVIGVILIPGILIGLVFLLPFLDRSPERRPWKRPIPVGGVLIVLIGLVGLGMQSRLDDSRDPTTASQIAQQQLAEDQYFRAPFEPYSAASASGGAAPGTLSTAAIQGKPLFASHGCGGCHGAGGAGGGVGPALTHISDKFPAAQLTALLKEPNAKMKAGGMVPLTLNDSEMTALVAYVSSLGGSSLTVAAAPATTSALVPAPAPAAAPAGASSPSRRAAPVPRGESAADGKTLFASHNCSSCHGIGGVGGGVGPPLTHISDKFPVAQLTALLKEPTRKMKAGGMVPLTLNAADMTALVSYVSSLGGASPPAATASASVPTSQPAPAHAPAPASLPSGAAAPAPADETVIRGKTLFTTHNCSSCHGMGGVGGGVAPALTDVSAKFPVAQLTALLRQPTDKMQAGGMVPLTLNAADMTALVSYVSSLGGTSPTRSTGQAPPPPSAASTGNNNTPSAIAAAPSAEADSSSPAAISAGRRIYNGTSNCWMCHGAKLEGTPVAPPLLAHDWKDAPDGAYGAIVGVVLSGVPGTAMAGHAGGISDAEAKKVAAYVWAVSHGNAKP